ncbi:hypothetical protein ONZ45_g9100 [Pleurotus djamor]|nr:hypothetical protein ONZ45_g9100 [Pleurotus djamor]
MPGGRPRLYHTPEERKEGDRRNSRRYYNRTQIKKLNQSPLLPAPRTPTSPKANRKPPVTSSRGRPRIYTTDEERNIANREKSKRYYTKKKAALPIQRRRFQAESTKNLIIAGATLSKGTPSANPVDTAGWMQLVNSVSNEFHLLTKGSAVQYAELIYKQLVEGRRDGLNEALLQLDHLGNVIKRCMHAILQLEGVQSDFRKVSAAERLIREACAYMEELSCYASMDRGELVHEHEMRQLRYQIG